MLSLPHFTSKRSIRFYKTFLSYAALVLILLTVVSVIIYGNFIRVLRSEVENSSVTVLAQIRDAMDERIADMERIALQIGADPLLTPYVASHYGYNSYLAVAEMKKYRSSNSFIYDMALLFDESDTINASSGTYSVESFFRTYQFSQWSEASLHEAFDRMEDPVMIPLQAVTVNKVQEMNMSVYLVPLPMHSGKPYGAIMYLIDEQALQRMVANVHHHNEGYFYILDGDLRPLFSTSSDRMNLDKRAIFQDMRMKRQEGTVSDVSIGNQSYSVMQLSSNHNQWAYVDVIPTEQIMSKVQHIRSIYRYSIAVILLLGLLLSFTLADKNYQLLRKLVQITRDQQFAQPAKIGGTDEIAILSTTIHHAASVREELKVKLRSRKGLVREQLLASLLRGASDRTMKTTEPDDGGVQWPYSAFVVVLFCIDGYAKFTRTYDPATQQLLTFSIINVTEELSMDWGVGYGLDLGDGRGVALLLNLKEGCRQEDAGELAERARTFFRQNYPFTLTVGIGNLYARPEDLHLSYTEAQEAMTYRFILGADQLIYRREATRHDAEQAMKPKYPVELEEQLARDIKQGRADLADGTMEAMFRYAREHASPEEARRIGYSTIHVVVKTLEELDLDGASVNQIRVLMQEAESVDELHRELSRYCAALCDSIANRKESKNFELRDKVLDYVRDNYRDSSLTLEGIAEEFRLSPSYLTRFMKNQTGYSLIQYLDMLRMNHAKELLHGGELTIRRILDEVGYVNETNFIRKFKKLEGITPAQYRVIWKSR
jgi:AraC-like DNA-binding protein